MESNVFILPRSVDTLNTGRIKTNKSSSALLQKFYDINPPTDESVTIENQSGLLGGMLWNKKYSENIPTALHVHSPDNSFYFTRAGLLRTDVNTFSYAQQLLYDNVFQSGELIRCFEEDILYIVSDSGASLVPVGIGSKKADTANNTIYLGGNAYSNFLKTNYDTVITGNVKVASIVLGSTLISGDAFRTLANVGNNSITFSNSNPTLSFIDTGTVLRANTYVDTTIYVAGSNVNLDVSRANKFVVNATSNINISLSNASPNNNVAVVSVIYHNTGYFYLNWPSSVMWPNGAEPFPPIAGNVGSYTLITTNNGNSWYGILTSNRY